MANYYSFKIYLYLLNIEELDANFKDEITEVISKFPQNIISSRFDIVNFRLKQLAENNNDFKTLSDKLDRFINNNINNLFNLRFGRRRK